MKEGVISIDELSMPNRGCLNIWIDEIVPCLRETETGEMKDTVVFRIESRSYLKKFQVNNGWHIDWNNVPSDVEVYALALLETNEIQGLIGIRNDFDSVYMHWACTAPQNNKHDLGKQKYAGVGGHLFAIAIDKSVQWGHEGAVYGFAANEELLNHYIESFGAVFVGILRKYHFVIPEERARKLLEVYHYEWN